MYGWILCVNVCALGECAVVVKRYNDGQTDRTETENKKLNKKKCILINN